MVPAKTELFLRALHLRGKTDLSKGYWYRKRKLGLTIHFSEIMKLQFGKKCHTLFCILGLFRIIAATLSQKMRGYPQISFWIQIALGKICFFCIVINRAKILWN